jgi:hypothetical protein
MNFSLPPIPCPKTGQHHKPRTDGNTQSQKGASLLETLEDFQARTGQL